MAKLKAEYETLAAELERKSDLSAAVAPYASVLTADPATETELAAAERNTSRMIEVARGIAEEEKARRDQEKRRVELASYRSAMPGMRAKISEAEGSWYTRFTDAYDAAMACMPVASTPEDEYCVAKNAYTMGNELAWRARSFPRKWVCDKTSRVETICGIAREGGHDCVKEGCAEGHMEGADYTADELRSFATGYCTTQCR